MSESLLEPKETKRKKVRKKGDVELVPDLPLFKISNTKLTMEEKIFVCAFCSNGFNASKAFKTANPEILKAKNPDRKASQIGWEMKNKQHIQEAIKEYLSSALDEFKETLHYKIIKANILRAFYDIGDYYDDKGKAKPLSGMTEEQRICIDGVKKLGEETVYTLANRDKSIDILVKYMNIIKPETGDSEIDLKIIQDIAGKQVQIKIERQVKREQELSIPDWVEEGED